MKEKCKGRNHLSHTFIDKKEEWCDLLRNKILSMKDSLSKESIHKANRTNSSMCSIRKHKPLNDNSLKEPKAINRTERNELYLNLPSIALTNRLGSAIHCSHPNLSSLNSSNYSQRVSQETLKLHLMKIRLKQKPKQKKPIPMEESRTDRLKCLNNVNVNMIKFDSSVLSQSVSKHHYDKCCLGKTRAVNVSKVKEELNNKRKQEGLVIKFNPVLTKVIKKVKRNNTTVMDCIKRTFNFEEELNY